MGPEKGEPVEPHQAARQGGCSRHGPAASCGRVAGPGAALKRKGPPRKRHAGQGRYRCVLERGRLEKVRPRNWKSGAPRFSSPGADPGAMPAGRHRPPATEESRGPGASPESRAGRSARRGGRAVPGCRARFGDPGASSGSAANHRRFASFPRPLFRQFLRAFNRSVSDRLTGAGWQRGTGCSDVTQGEAVVRSRAGKRGLT